MTLRVVGAGLARTGATSLKLAVERLAGGRCYHMADVFAYPEHIRIWHDAIGGRPPDWDKFLSDYRAAVDLPASAFLAGTRRTQPGRPHRAVRPRQRRTTVGQLEPRHHRGGGETDSP